MGKAWVELTHPSVCVRTRGDLLINITSAQTFTAMGVNGVLICLRASRRLL